MNDQKLASFYIDCLLSLLVVQLVSYYCLTHNSQVPLQILKGLTRIGALTKVEWDCSVFFVVALAAGVCLARQSEAQASVSVPGQLEGSICWLFLTIFRSIGRSRRAPVHPTNVIANMRIPTVSSMSEGSARSESTAPGRK